jgi:hypothetical protein
MPRLLITEASIGVPTPWTSRFIARPIRELHLRIRKIVIALASMAKVLSGIKNQILTK